MMKLRDLPQSLEEKLYAITEAFEAAKIRAVDPTLNTYQRNLAAIQQNVWQQKLLDIGNQCTQWYMENP